MVDAMNSEQDNKWREKAKHWEDVAKDQANLIGRLESIARRAGAWEDRNGNLLYGSDPVVCDSHDIVYPAMDIEPNLRKFYYLRVDKK